MTAIDAKGMAELFMPLRGRMEKAGCWPERTRVGDVPRRALGLLEYRDKCGRAHWWWDGRDYCDAPDAANALRCAAGCWLCSFKGVCIGRHAELAAWILCDEEGGKWEGETIDHALATALDALLPKDTP